MKRFIEPALAIGLVFALIVGAKADTMQKNIANQVLRLHVIANSDSLTDQEEKLVVRDKVLECSESLLSEAESIDDVKNLISDNLPLIVSAAQEVTSRPVRAELTTMYFPTRKYDTFTLPAGEYEAVRIIIGDGKGRNWWCVMFPPLCVSSSDAISAAKDAGLNDEEIELISKGENVYRYKFRFLEFLTSIKDFLF